MRRSAVATAVLAVALVAGCSRPRMPRDWTDVGSRIGMRGEVAYFAGVENLSVHDGARLSARVVGYLTLHQMVLRSGVDNGYARIRLPDGTLRGWVNNAKLLAELPSDGESVP